MSLRCSEHGWRVGEKEIARISNMPDDDYRPSRETLRSILWTIHYYREEMLRLQEDVRNGNPAL